MTDILIMGGGILLFITAGFGGLVLAVAWDERKARKFCPHRRWGWK